MEDAEIEKSAKKEAKMSYVTQVLQPEERVLMSGRPHWITYRERQLPSLLHFWCSGLAASPFC